MPSGGPCIARVRQRAQRKVGDTACCEVTGVSRDSLNRLVFHWPVSVFGGFHPHSGAIHEPRFGVWCCVLGGGPLYRCVGGILVPCAAACPRALLPVALIRFIFVQLVSVLSFAVVVAVACLLPLVPDLVLALRVVLLQFSPIQRVL